MPASSEAGLSVENVVLATDLSCRCDRALARAAELAGEWRTPLHVVTAVHRDFHMPSWRSQSRSALDAARAELSLQLADEDIAWDLTLESDSPAEAVSEATKRYPAPLIVTGVARNELLGRTHPGGTVEALLRHLPAPLLVVRRPPRGPYRNILHPTDLSPSSARVIKRVQAWFPEAQLTLLHAYRVPFAGFVPEDTHWEETRDQATRRAKAFLSELEADAKPKQRPTLLIEYGHVEPLVSDFVEARGADLVVVANHLQDGLPFLAGAGHTLSLLMACGADVLALPEAAMAKAAPASRGKRGRKGG